MFLKFSFWNIEVSSNKNYFFSIEERIDIINKSLFSDLKLNKKNFPVTNSHLKKIITFPCDQHKTKKELNYIIKTVKSFYGLNV